MTSVRETASISLSTGRKYILKAVKILHENIIILYDGVTGEEISKLEST